MYETRTFKAVYETSEYSQYTVTVLSMGYSYVTITGASPIQTDSLLD